MITVNIGRVVGTTVRKAVRDEDHTLWSIAARVVDVSLTDVMKFIGAKPGPPDTERLYQQVVTHSRQGPDV